MSTFAFWFILNLEEIRVFKVGFTLLSLINNVVYFGVLCLTGQTTLTAAGWTQNSQTQGLRTKQNDTNCGKKINRWVVNCGLTHETIDFKESLLL